jgi:pSer/pThr/pTyr-binding forkhead associated (FHA) protein
VSREHFEIDRDDTGYILVDRGSTSGTIVEGRTSRPAVRQVCGAARFIPIKRSRELSGWR